VTCHASGSRSSDVGAGPALGGGVCPLANGIQSTNAAAAGNVHTPSAPRQLSPITSPNGTVVAAATAAEPLSAIV
jgi:hypothetical protein